MSHQAASDFCEHQELNYEPLSGPLRTFFITSIFILTCLLAVPTAFGQVGDTDGNPTPTLKEENLGANAQAGSKNGDASKALIARLEKYLSGTKWTGQFTRTGKPGTEPEIYEIISASKNEVGDFWNLTVRIKYGGKDKTLLLPPIEIKFAGQTPVITVDRVLVPGFGTFDARVLIRQGQYAGTWSHSGGVGGHLFGEIEKIESDDSKKE